MNKPDESKWIRLVLEDEEGYSYFAYEDGLGKRLPRPLENYRIMEREIFFPDRPPTWIRYSEKMDECILAVANAEPGKHDTADGPKPIPIAVYLDILIEPKSRLEFGSIEKLVTDHLTWVLEGDHDFQIVFYHHKAEVSKPFSLPFNIRVTDIGASKIITSLQDANWYKNSIEVDEFGVNIRDISINTSYEEAII